MTTAEMKWRSIGGKKPDREEQTAFSPCLVCEGLTGHWDWEAPVCDECQEVVKTQLTASLPLLQRRLETNYKADVHAFLRAGRLPNARWAFGQAWSKKPYEPTDTLVEQVARRVAVAVAYDYRYTEGGVSVFLGDRREDGAILCGYYPYVDGDDDDAFSDALATALRPRVREWLTSALPDAVAQMDGECIAQEVLRHAIGHDVEDDVEDDDAFERGSTMSSAASLAHGSGLSRGGYWLLDLNVIAVDESHAQFWVDPFSWGDDLPQAAWYEMLEELPPEARRYCERTRDWVAHKYPDRRLEDRD